MRQLLIVKSDKALNAGATNAFDLSTLQDGALAAFELGTSDGAFLNAAVAKNFAIALGRMGVNGVMQRPFVIPEIDFKTLKVTKTLPSAGNKFSVEFTMPTTVVGSEYTLRFFKKGTVPHERNSWTVSIVAKTTTAATEAAAFIKAVNDRTNDKFNLTATVSTATVTITGNDYEDWNVVAYDSLVGTSLTITNAKKPIGDKAYIQELASFCAAGKGFEHTASEGREFIPGYPENVEDALVINPVTSAPGTPADGDIIWYTGTTSGGLTKGKYYKYVTADTEWVEADVVGGYAVYTLRFQVGRDASKTRDERVWQNVYIAIPTSNAAMSTLDTIFGL